MSPYWLNDSCSPFDDPDSPCTLGNIAVYAIDVDSAETAAAGLKFAQEKNIRLSIKNTGHDYTGRSNGLGSLALWMHNLDDMTFFNYSSPGYSGPALKAGAGVQFFNAYKEAAANDLRVLGGYCPSVGIAGGYVQGGGHGPLAASYGMAADNTLEFEVVTVDGRHLTASPTENSDLYWALSGGGGGNYAVVLSLTTKAHVDGPTAGASLSFANTNADQYWAAIEAFQKRLIPLNSIPGFSSSWGLDNIAFDLNVATWPGASQSDMKKAFEPFLQDLQKLNVTASFNTTSHESFYDHYEYYVFPPEIYQTNNSLGGRLIPPSTVQNNLPGLIDAFRQIATDNEFPVKRISANGLNVTYARVGSTPNSNSVLPAWRDALYTLNFGIIFDPDASPQELQAIQAKVNVWQALFTPLTPGGGAYMNEATFDDLNWKEDYFGQNYNALLKIKEKYDPQFALWQHSAVGADAYWEVESEGRLCRIA